MNMAQAIKQSIQEERIRQALLQNTQVPEPLVMDGTTRQQIELMQATIREFNQDTAAILAINQAMEAFERKQREDQEKQEAEEERLRQERHKQRELEEKKANKDKGKGKMTDDATTSSKQDKETETAGKKP